MRDFPRLSRPALGPTQPLVQWVQVFPGGKERPGRDADPSPPSSAVVIEGYRPYGSYGLYRASVPVQRCTLPSPLPITLILRFSQQVPVHKRMFKAPSSLHVSCTVTCIVSLDSPSTAQTELWRRCLWNMSPYLWIVIKIFKITGDWFSLKRPVLTSDIFRVSRSGQRKLEILDMKCGKKLKFILEQATKAQRGSKWIALLCL